MEVNIYVDIYHTGHLKTGTGTYTVVLEYISKSGKAATKTYIGGIRGTSANRTALYACIRAMESMVKPCQLSIRINSEYIVQSSQYFRGWISNGKNAKGKPVKNLDLWQQLAGLMDPHEVNFIYADSSSYTPAMETMLKHTKIEYKEESYV